ARAAGGRRRRLDHGGCRPCPLGGGAGVRPQDPGRREQQQDSGGRAAGNQRQDATQQAPALDASDGSRASTRTSPTRFDKALTPPADRGLPPNLMGSPLGSPVPT